MSNNYTPKRKVSNQRYRDKLSKVEVWLTPDEKAAIVEIAKKEKKSMSGYFRSLAGLKATPLREEDT
jgi:hypothetical protein